MDNARYVEALASARTSRRIRELVQQVGSKVTGNTTFQKYRQLTSALRDATGARGRRAFERMPEWQKSPKSKMPSGHDKITGQSVDAITRFFSRAGGAFNQPNVGIGISPATIKMTARAKGRDLAQYKGVLPAFMAHEFGEAASMEKSTYFPYAKKAAPGGIHAYWRAGSELVEVEQRALGAGSIKMHPLGHVSRHPMMAEYRMQAAIGYSQGGTEGAIGALRAAIAKRQRMTADHVAGMNNHPLVDMAADELSVMDRRILRVLEKKEKTLAASQSNATVNPLPGLSGPSKSRQRAARSPQKPATPPMQIEDITNEYNRFAAGYKRVLEEPAPRPKRVKKKLGQNPPRPTKRPGQVVPDGMSRIAANMHYLTKSGRLGEGLSVDFGTDVEKFLPYLETPTLQEMERARAATGLKSEFSISASRIKLFEKDPEKYFLNYYASWGGWEEDAPMPVKQLYYRKKMQNAKMWVGTEVHEQIRQTILGLTTHSGEGAAPGAAVKISAKLMAEEKRKRIERVSSQNHLDAMLTRMEARFQDSARGDHVHRASKILRLQEHEAGMATDRLLAQAQTKATQHYKAFTQSQWFQEAADPRNFMQAIDETNLPHFFIDGIKITSKDLMREGDPVFAGPDLMYTNPRTNKTTIVDWKTDLFRPGMTTEQKAAKLAEYNQQLRIYALYANKEHGVDPKNMRLVLAHMHQGRIENHIVDVNQNVLNQTEREIVDSANKMKFGLIHPDINQARPEAYLNVERRAEMERRVPGPSEAELQAGRKTVAEKAAEGRKLGNRASVTIENAWDAIPRKWKIGGGIGAAALGAWWLFGSHNNSKKADPRARGYGWTNADIKTHPGSGTARLMYDAGPGGMGGIA